METLKLFVYLITGAWCVYYALGMFYCIVISHIQNGKAMYDVEFSGVLITVVLLCLSAAFYFGGA